MAALRAFQEEFKRLVFFSPVERSRSPLWGGKVPERMGVYRNNARGNWIDALDCDFPLTRRQFARADWENLRRSYFRRHPPRHWELNNSLAPFPRFLASQAVEPHIKELADYEWRDLAVFIDRSPVRRGGGAANPTAVVGAYRHQIFDWVNRDRASPRRPPRRKPEVLVFYRDSRNTCHIREADPLMLLLLDAFKRPKPSLASVERARRRLLPGNRADLEKVRETLLGCELLL